MHRAWKLPFPSVMWSWILIRFHFLVFRCNSSLDGGHKIEWVTIFPSIVKNCHFIILQPYKAAILNKRQELYKSLHLGNQHLEFTSYQFTVTKKLVTKFILRHVKCQFMRRSNTHAINVAIKLVVKVASKDIKSQFMRRPSTHAINVTMKLITKEISRDI